MGNTLTIGAVARRAGVGVETIRFYQRKGLLTEPPKPAAGFRQYPPDTIDRLRFIQRAKELGFTLDEIGVLLQLNASECTVTRALTQQKLDAVRAKIADLRAMEVALDQLVTTCNSSQPTNSCPIIAALNKN